MKDLVAIVLAAGKGTRINARKINKVMYPLAGKPMIAYTIELIKKAGFSKIIIVIGFAKESIIRYLGKKLTYAEQRQRLGTAHALKCALTKVPLNTRNIFVCYSDDTAFYPPEVIKKLIKLHCQKNQDLTLLTVIKKDPTGLGRIIRDRRNKIINIVEDKSTTLKQKKIKEINTGLYCFKYSFLKEYLPLIKKDPLKKEYYLTDIVPLAIRDKKKVKALKVNQDEYFQGINTKEQLKRADIRMKQKLKKKAKNN